MPEGVRIPMPPGGAELVQPYPVRVPQFEGPLDLLLHLIRKNEVDLRDIPVADICHQYHEYLLLMQEVDLEVAGEFLYVEALLVHIKSQLVLPRSANPGGDPMIDPREELVRRLIEYRRVKVAAEMLHEMETERQGLWPRPAQRLEAGSEEETDFSEVSLFDLLTFYKTAVERFKDLHPAALQIVPQAFSIKEKMEDVVRRLGEAGGRFALSEVFRALSGRAEAIALFLALLELLRLRMVLAFQAEEFGEIYLEATGESLSLEAYEEAYR